MAGVFQNRVYSGIIKGSLRYYPAGSAGGFHKFLEWNSTEKKLFGPQRSVAGKKCVPENQRLDPPKKRILFLGGGMIPLMFRKVPQSSLEILRVPQLPPSP